MRRFLSLLLLLSATSLTRLPADDASPLAEPAPAISPAAPIAAKTAPAATAQLSFGDAIILGLVEGVTEFLPISSTGHLIIASHALDLEDNRPLLDTSGAPLWHKAPSAKHPAGIPLTAKLAADTYTVVIQVGAIAAVIILYWSQFAAILSGLIGQNASGLRLLRNITLAFLPCATIGYLTHEWIDEHLFSPQAVVVALISGAVLMFAAERWRKQQHGTTTSRLEPSELTAPQALGIGLMQCLALWPGTSRSMVTMVGGYFCGLSPAKSAEFSFLVGLPTLAGAAVLKGYKSGPAMLTVFGWEPVLLGVIVAALSAALAVKFLVNYLARHGLEIFAIYRLLLAGFIGAWLLI